MRQEVVFTDHPDVELAVDELIKQLKGDRTNYNLVLFFASSNYDFYELSALLKKSFPNSELVGTSTSGEISKNGFTKNSIVLTTMSCEQTEVKGVLIKDTDKYPMIYKKNIIEAMNACGIKENTQNSHKDAFAITFINGLCNAEEAILALLYAVIGNDDFQVIGGSAGDDLKFDTTFVSYNGEVVTNGGVVVFIKTSKKFIIQKENIFKPSGKKVTLTKVDTNNRKLIEINNKAAAVEYSKQVGIAEEKIDEASLMHPIGRTFGSNIFISSIASVNNDKSFNMYCRVMPNTIVDIMELDDVDAIIVNTCKDIKQAIQKPGFVFFINCILRTLQFESMKKCNYLVEAYSNTFDTFCGFSSYGEQINKVNSNQTLVVLALEE